MTDAPVKTLIGAIRTVLGDDFCVVFGAEVGSRANGTATWNSDYDVLCVVVQTLASYLSVFPRVDAWVVETVHDGIPMNITVWDVRKALILFAQSNPSLLDALFSPQVYISRCGFAQKLVELVKEGYYSLQAYIGHCIGLAKKASEPRNRIPKRLLLTLSALVRARYAEIRESIPPQHIPTLIDLCAELYSEGSTGVDGKELQEILRLLLNAKNSGVSAIDGDIYESAYHRALSIRDREIKRLSRYRSGRKALRVPEPILNRIFLETVMCGAAVSGTVTIRQARQLHAVLGRE